MTKWVHTQHITEHNTYWKNREHYRRGKTFYSLFFSKWFSCSQISCFRGKKELWRAWKGIVACLPLEDVCKLAAGLRCHLRAQNGLQLPPLAHRWEEGLKATANWLCELLGNCREVTAIRQDPIKFKVHWRIFKSEADAAFNPKLMPSWGESQSNRRPLDVLWFDDAPAASLRAHTIRKSFSCTAITDPSTKSQIC